MCTLASPALPTPRHLSDGRYLPSANCISTTSTGSTIIVQFNPVILLRITVPAAFDCISAAGCVSGSSASSSPTAHNAPFFRGDFFLLLPQETTNQIAHEIKEVKKNSSPFNKISKSCCCTDCKTIPSYFLSHTLSFTSRSLAFGALHSGQCNQRNSIGRTSN